MKTQTKWVMIFALAVPALAQHNDREVMDVQEANEPPMVAHWARGQARAATAGGRSPNMTYHNGTVLDSITTYNIFWGTSWNNYTGDKISGLDLWYNGVSGSKYPTTNSEYTDYLGHHPTTVASHMGHVVDTSAAPSGAPKTSDILNKVCSTMGNSVQPNGFYSVYVDTKRGNAGYCAWHSWSSCNGVPIQFSFYFNLDGDAGCDPQSTVPGHSQGLAALANVTGHEFSETVTDPRGAGWFDRQGAENGDKCAWSFGSSFVTFSNSSQWKIQGNWSNAAYNTSKGYANRSGQKGCLDGNQ